MPNPLLKKLNGYQKANRARFKLLTDTRFKLKAEEFILYEFLIAITDWDETHTETYGTFEATDKDVAELLNWRSGSTVNRWKKCLISKELLKKQYGSRFRVVGFDKWKLRKGEAKNEGRNAFLQIEDAKTHTSFAEIDNNQVQNADYSLVSSKVQSNDVAYDKLTDDEVSQIILDIDSKELSSESGESQKDFSSVNLDYQLALAKSIFGEGTKWAEDTLV